VKFIKTSGSFIALSMILVVAGCSPEVGSDAWCEDMKDKPSKEWSTREAADYAKHCIFR
jgi:hypothetical protein